MAGGRSNTGICERLALSPKTVEGHVRTIFTKLGVSSRVQAVAIAYRDGLVAPATELSAVRAKTAASPGR